MIVCRNLRQSLSIRFHDCFNLAALYINDLENQAGAKTLAPKERASGLVCCRARARFTFAVVLLSNACSACTLCASSEGTSTPRYNSKGPQIHEYFGARLGARPTQARHIFATYSTYSLTPKSREHCRKGRPCYYNWYRHPSSTPALALVLTVGRKGWLSP